MQAVVDEDALDDAALALSCPAVHRKATNGGICLPPCKGLLPVPDDAPSGIARPHVASTFPVPRLTPARCRRAPTTIDLTPDSSFHLRRYQEASRRS